MIELSEYDSGEDAGLAPAEHLQQSIRQELENRLDILWLAGGRVRVDSKQWVGVVRIPGGPTVQVTPKLAGDNLRVLTMVALTSGLPTADLPGMQRDLSSARDGDALELLCLLVVRAAERIILAGPIQDYRGERADLRFVRGRVDVHRQALTHFGRVDVLACEFQEFDHDVLENRLLRVALARVRSLSRKPEIRRKSVMLHEDFQALAPGPIPSTSEVRRLFDYNRRNEHYRSAHIWALALLDGLLLDKPFSDSGTATAAFLINMNTLFEQFTTWLFRESFKGTEIVVRPQHRDDGVLQSEGQPWGTLIPDILLTRGRDDRIAVDAKYKMYDTGSPDSSDIYQLLVYAQAYQGFSASPRSVLIYPSVESISDVQIDLVPGTHPVASVVAVGIELPDILDRLAKGEADPLASIRARLRATLGID